MPLHREMEFPITTRPVRAQTSFLVFEPMFTGDDEITLISKPLDEFDSSLHISSKKLNWQGVR